MSDLVRRAMRATLTESVALDVVTRLLRALERGATGTEIGRFYADDATVEDMPNRYAPAGGTRDKAALIAAAERGRQLFTRQTYAVQHAIAENDRVAIELRWTGELRGPLGEHPAGAELRSRSVIIADVQGGLIVAQRCYDCFER